MLEVLPSSRQMRKSGTREMAGQEAAGVRGLQIHLTAHRLQGVSIWYHLASPNLEVIQMNGGGQEAFLRRRHQGVAPFPPKDEIALRQDGL